MQSVEADARDGQDLPRRAHRDNPAQLAAERRDRRALERGGDGRAHRCSRPWPGVGEHARAGEQRASGAPAQAVVEGELEAADADERIAGHAF